MSWRRAWVWMAWIVALGAVIASALASSGYGGSIVRVARQLPGADKTGHFLLMGLLSLCVNLALDLARFDFGLFRPLKGTALVWVAASVEEFSQLLLPRRTFSLEDLSWSYAGVVACGWLAVVLTKVVGWLRESEA